MPANGRKSRASLHYAENRLFRHVPIQDRLAICPKVNWVPAFLRSIATASDRRRDDVAGGEKARADLEVALGPLQEFAALQQVVRLLGGCCREWPHAISAKFGDVVGRATLRQVPVWLNWPLVTRMLVLGHVKERAAREMP